MKKFLIINGPNINLLGIREPSVYGKQDYSALCDIVDTTCNDLNIEYEIFQSNHEGDIVDKIQNAYNNADGIIINPAAYTHTSIAILDALKAVSIPTVEVHISDVSAREDFRQISYTSMVAIKTLMGFGIDGYRRAIIFLNDYLSNQ